MAKGKPMPKSRAASSSGAGTTAKWKAVAPQAKPMPKSGAASSSGVPPGAGFTALPPSRPAWARIRIWPAAERQFKKDKAKMEMKIARMERELAESDCFIKQTPWPCKVCGKEPFFTVWHVGDDGATSPLNTETRICDKCYSKLEADPSLHCLLARRRSHMV